MAQFEKGHEPLPGAGRPKGSLNKSTKAIKEMIEQALEEEGGVEYLRTVAKEDRATFCSLIRSILPKDISLSASDSLAEILAQLFDKGSK